MDRLGQTPASGGSPSRPSWPPRRPPPAFNRASMRPMALAASSSPSTAASSSRPTHPASSSDRSSAPQLAVGSDSTGSKTNQVSTTTPKKSAVQFRYWPAKLSSSTASTASTSHAIAALPVRRRRHPRTAGTSPPFLTKRYICKATN